MKNLKKLFRFFRILLFAFMLAVCVVLGVAPILPKRKEEAVVEATIETIQRSEDETVDYTDQHRK